MKQHEQKLCFDYLAIEITRRCNLRCTHCLKGDAQDIDISQDIINNLLDQTEIIHTIFFSGGEPTLNIGALRYILDQLRTRGIPLYSIEMITNGTIQTPEVVDIYKDYYSYIQQCRKNQNIVEDVVFLVSVDKYRVGYDPRHAIAYYKSKLEGFATVDEHRLGNAPEQIGRGKMLKGAARPRPADSVAHQINIITPGEQIICNFLDRFKRLPSSLKIVVCPVFLSAIGDIIQLSQCAMEYADEETRRKFLICNLAGTTPLAARCIERSIALYNQRNPSCSEAIKQALTTQSREHQRDPLLAVKDAAHQYKTGLRCNTKEERELRASLTSTEEKAALREMEVFLELAEIAELETALLQSYFKYR